MCSWTAKGGLYRWSILLSETEEVSISCKFEQSFVCLGKLLALPSAGRFSDIVI